MGTDSQPEGSGGAEDQGEKPGPEASQPGGAQPEAGGNAGSEEPSDLASLRRDVAKWRRLANERDSELRRHKEATQSESEKALGAAKREGFVEAENKYKSLLFHAEVRVAAAGVLTDPDDAVRLLDLEAIEADADGRPQPKSIKAALADLVKAKPYLAAKPTPGNGNGFGGSVDQGARQPASPSSGDAWVRGALSSRSGR